MSQAKEKMFLFLIPKANFVLFDTSIDEMINPCLQPHIFNHAP